MKVRRVHWICDSPSPYNTLLFRALGADPDIDLTVSYRRPELSSHPWSSSLRDGYASRDLARRLGVDWELLRTAWSRPPAGTSSLVVIAGWRCLTTALVAACLAAAGRPFVFWSDTPDTKRHRAPVIDRLRSVFISWLLRNSMAVMGTGRPALAALASLGARPGTLVNFPYWVDLGSSPRRPGSEASATASVPFRILSSGRLVNAQKGHDVVLRALALLGWRDHSAVEYRIAGVGPDEGALRKLASALGLGDVVRFLGWLEPEQMAAEFAQATVFAHPSPAHEPYGVVVLEAMAAGLPVLASDCTCSAIDRITSGFNGFIHPAGDAESLARQFLFLRENPVTALEIGRAARGTAEQWPVARGVNTIRTLLELPPSEGSA